MWTLQPTALYIRRLKKYMKNFSIETTAALANVARYKAALDDGVPPALITGGYVHPEPRNIKGIDQAGAKGSTHETRLYIYAFEYEERLYLLSIGDKRSQKRDIRECEALVDDILKEGKNG